MANSEEGEADLDLHEDKHLKNLISFLYIYILLLLLLLLLGNIVWLVKSKSLSIK